ncbi:helix-turn-helix transcriptional regulator [Escherichia coli]
MPKDHELLFLAIVNFIEKNIGNDKIIDELVNVMGYSKRYIYGVFKRYAGLSIGDYIRRRKITKAAILVKYTEKSIGNIAMELNFSSQQSFCRAFKKQFRVSPTQYRIEKEMNCKGLLKRISKENYNYMYEIVFKKSIMLKTTTLRYKENILKDHCKRGSFLKLKIIMELSKSKNNVYVSSTIQPDNETRQLINVISLIGTESNDFNHCTHQGTYAMFKFNGLWINYLEYSRNCFITFDKAIAPYPVIEEIIILEADNMHNPNCNIAMYIPINI